MMHRQTGILVLALAAWALANSGAAYASSDPVHASADLFRQGKTAEARALLETRIREMPDDEDAHLAYVALRIALGEREHVRKEYDALVLKDPSNPAVQLSHLVLLGDSNEKLVAFREYVEENPDFARAWEEYGRFLIDRFQVDPARAAVEKAVKLAPGRATTHLLLGIIYRAAGEREREEAELRKALGLDPDSEQAGLELGTTLAYKGDLDEAKRLLAALENRTPDSPERLSILALVEERLGRREEAVALRRRVIELDPRFPGKLVYLGTLHTAIPNHDLAKRSFELAVFLDSSFVEPYMQLGLVYRIEGKQDDAIRCYETAVRLQDSNQLGWRNLGMSYYDKGDIESAEKFVRKALDADPDFLLGWVDYARILQQRDKREEAIGAWKRVNEMAPYGWQGFEARNAIALLEKGEAVAVPAERQQWLTPAMRGAVKKRAEEGRPERPSGSTK